jgi:flagellar FliL protein
MKKSRRIILIVLFGLLVAGASGGAVWWWSQRQALAATASPRPEYDKQEYRYISLDKIIVMLRTRAGEPMSHYLAVDLVFKTPVEKERFVRDQLPMLRSVALRAMSEYSLDKALVITIDQLAADLNAAYKISYEQDNHEKPFAEVLVGKLIVE